jgi:hypothetical protein
VTFKESIEKSNEDKSIVLGFDSVDSYYKALEKATRMHGFVLSDEVKLRFKD